MASLDPGATTFGEMTDEIVGNLLGYVRDQESASHLTADLNASDTQFAVYDISSAAGEGAAEIDDEIIWLQSVDRTNNTASVPPYGRGYQGSTATTHTSGTRVTFAPRFPRHRVKRAVNQTLAAMGDQLPALGSTTLVADAMTVTYELPADAEQVLDLRWQTVGPTAEWFPVKRWNVNQKANTTAFATGKSVDIFDGMTPGQDIQVTYVKNPTLLSAASDLFTATGYTAQVYDVVLYGTMARLVSVIEAARLDFKSVEADQLDTPTPMGSGTALSKYFQQMYLMRLEEERSNYFQKFQVRIRRQM